MLYFCVKFAWSLEFFKSLRTTSLYLHDSWLYAAACLVGLVGCGLNLALKRPTKTNKLVKFGLGNGGKQSKKSMNFHYFYLLIIFVMEEQC